MRVTIEKDISISTDRFTQNWLLRVEGFVEDYGSLIGIGSGMKVQRRRAGGDLYFDGHDLPALLSYEQKSEIISELEAEYDRIHPEPGQLVVERGTP